MNNPFEGAEVQGITVDMTIAPKNTAAYLWSVDVLDSTVKPGEEIQVEAVVESYLAEKKRYRTTLKVPENLEPGKYSLQICGANDYEQFVSKARPYKFLATNYQTLVEALNDALNISRTKLYVFLLLPTDGIALDRAELPGLPETKALILQSERRAVNVQPYAHWVEKTIETGTVIADKHIVPIVVER
jgi:hypothetical protein